MSWWIVSLREEAIAAVCTDWVIVEEIVSGGVEEARAWRCLRTVKT